MRTLAWIIAVLAGLALLAGIWVRVAPVDVTRWHVDMSAPGFAPPANAAVFCPKAGDQPAPDLSDPKATLAALDAIAMATPRTTRLSGSPAEGRITWITRSLIFGFPDYTTAAVLTGPEGAPRFCVIARQGFGSYDWGVNAARLKGWLKTLLGVSEAPALGSF